MVKPKRTQRELDEMRAKAYQSELQFQRLIKEKQAGFSSLINPVIPDPSIFEKQILQEAKQKIAVKDKVNQLRNDITEKEKAEKKAAEDAILAAKNDKTNRALAFTKATDAQTKALNELNEWMAQMKKYQENKVINFEEDPNKKKMI